MPKSSFTSTMLAAAWLFAVTTQISPAQAQLIAPLAKLAIETGSADQAVAANAVLKLRFVEPFPYAAGRFAVMLGSEDITAHFTLKDAQTLEGRFTDAPLPEGDHVLKVFGISADNEWAQVVQLDIKITPPPGGRWRAEIKPGAVVQVKGQLADRRSSTAPAAPSRRGADTTVQASLTTDHGNEAWGVKTDTRLLAASNRAERLQWGNRGDQASAVDLASYLVTGVHQPDSPTATQLAIGSVQAGEHPLLAAGIGHRGVVFNQQLGERAGLMLSSQSSTALLGTRNLSGLADGENRFTFATLGYELLARAGGLRAEVTGFTGTRRAAASPGSSALPPAQSRGLGLRLLGTSEDNRWRGELAIARSDNTPLIAVGSNWTQGPEQQREAYVVEVRRELVQGLPLWTSRPDLALSLSAALRRERTAPQYESLGASLNPDALNDSLELAGSIGPASASLRLQRQHDNLDADPARTRNQAPTLALQVALPLGPLLDAEAPGPWWPALQYSFGHQRDYGDPRFVPAGSTRASLADTLGLTHTLGLTWSIKGVNLGYTLNRTARDDRQPGSELNDSTNTGHGVTLAWAASERLSLGGNLGWTVDHTLPAGLRTSSRSGGLNVEWSVAPGSQLSSQVAYTSSHDRPLTGSTSSWSGAAQFKHDFKAVAFGLKVPGNVWVRYGFNHNAVRVGTALVGEPVRVEAVTAGLGLAF